MLKRLTKIVLDKPWLFIGVAVIITVLTGSLIPNLTFDASIDAMIPDDDPVLSELQKVADDFGSQELFLIAIQSDDVFQASTLRKISELEKKIGALPGIEDVQSPLNVQLVESSFFGIDIHPATTTLPQTKEEIEEYRETILSSPYVDRFITRDGRGAALMVDFEQGDGVDRYELAAEIESIVEGYKGPEQIHIIGDSYVMYYTETAMKQDLRNLVPFVVLVIAVILYITFKSFLGIFIPMVTVLASLIWTTGIMVLMDIPVSIISMVMPIVLVTLGIASSIHILNKYKEALASGLEKRQALEATYEAISSPVVMAALTTAAGFASLVTAFVHPIREFGVLTAIGVMLAMGLSITLIPAILILVDPPTASEKKDQPKQAGRLDKLLKTLTNWTITSPKNVIIVVAIVLVAIGIGAFKITLESNIINYFDDSSPVKTAANVVEEVFGGSMQVSVVFDTGVEDGVKEPNVLNEMIAVQDYLNSFDTINHATSIADVVRELNQALWDGEPEFYEIPDTREAVAQQLLLFTMQGGSGLDSLVSYDFQRALVTAQMKSLDAGKLAEVTHQVEEYLENRFGDSNLSVRLVGTPKVMMRLMNRYVQTQVSSLITSTIAVGIIVALLMKSIGLGLLSLVPLVVTVIFNFGIMGYLGIPLDAVTSIIASLAIGIGIDYAIHYVSRYRLELTNGNTVEDAIRITGQTAGRGIFYNAIALIAGFLVLAFSQFRAISVFGYLISVTMIVSSLATLLVIPVLLQTYEKYKKERGTKMKKKAALLIALFLVLGVHTVSAASLTGQEVLEGLELSSALSGSGRAEISMITENEKGIQRNYSLRVYRQHEDENEKQLLEYLAPADIRGTKFLSINEKNEENQMWLYLPAMGRERRIAAHMTGDSFMGTDFTYEEIGGELPYEDDYSAERLEDETIEGYDCYVLDLTPKRADVSYERVKMWVWKDEMIPVRIEFWNPADVLKKTLTLGDFRDVEGDLMPHHLIMADNTAGTRTIIEITETSREGISDDLFTLRYLRR